MSVVLVGDVGGTNARLRLVSIDEAGLQTTLFHNDYQGNDFCEFFDVVNEFLVANQFDNAHLHLIAPMTDFVRSADAIWDSGKQQNLLLNLIPKDTVQQAASLVFARAKVSSKDIAIIPNMKKSQTPTFIYISEQDKITSAVDWKAYKSTNVLIHKYLQLGHIEMVALADQNLLANFAGNLLGQKISIEDAAVIGRLCHIDNKQCMYE